MKTKREITKVTPAASEECGVWLDAGELREKKQQKRLMRPISKLLNPLARSGGYSMAVALSFTQTKMDMPVTRQSTISSFFQPQRKVNKDPEECSFSHTSEISSTLLSEAHAGTKRKRAATTESPLETKKVTSPTSHMLSKESDPDVEKESDPDVEKESDTDVENDEGQRTEQNFFHLIWGYKSEEHEPAEKRRYPEDATIENGTESNEAVSHRCRSADGIQDVPETLVQQNSNHQLHRSISASVSAENKNIFSQRHTFNASSAIGNQHTKKHPTDPQKELEVSQRTHHYYTHGSLMKRQDKENGGHGTEVSPLKRILVFEKPALFQKTKDVQSPKKLTKKSLENEQDSFAMLFTQDSEGFRVIANCNQQPRRPLKDRTNSFEGRDNGNLLVKPLQTEDDFDLEPEMLFTQDSQGNTVIKHSL